MNQVSSKEFSALLEEKIDHLFPRLVEIRRHLHMNPEISNKEFETTNRINEWLKEFGIPQIPANLKTGTAAEVAGKEQGPIIALRADIDALPIQEESNLPFRSKIDGVSHMCGHDIHTTIALGAGIVLQELSEILPGNVRILFQPAEETEGGAVSIIEAGLLKGVKSIIGLHNSPEIPTGTIGIKRGIFYGKCGRFYPYDKRKRWTCCAAEKNHYQIVIGSAVVSQLQTIVSRNISSKESAVISIGAFQAGATNNVIPDKAILKLTVRTSNEEVRQNIYELFKKVVTNTVTALGGEVEIDYQFLIPAVINDARVTEIVRSASVSVVGEENTLVSD